MAAWSKEELEQIAKADDLHIVAVPRRRQNLWHTDVDLVRQRRRRALRQGLQWNRVSLVSRRPEAEGWPDHCRRHDEGGDLRAGRVPK